jgi:hypothetical protein
LLLSRADVIWGKNMKRGGKNDKNVKAKRGKQQIRGK